MRCLGKTLLKVSKYNRCVAGNLEQAERAEALGFVPDPSVSLIQPILLGLECLGPTISGQHLSQARRGAEVEVRQ